MNIKGHTHESIGFLKKCSRQIAYGRVKEEGTLGELSKEPR